MLKQMGLDAAVSAREDTSAETDEDWYAYFKWIEGRKCVLFANVGTLYPFIVLDVRKSQLRELPKLLREEYERNLAHLGATSSQISQELLDLENLTIGKSVSQSTLGSMNDYSHQADVYIEAWGGVKEADSLRVSERLGEAPMSVIEYSSGIKELRKKLQTHAT